MPAVAAVKKPATGLRRGLDCCDDMDMPVICPTPHVVFSRAPNYRPTINRSPEPAVLLSLQAIPRKI
jgi:hypothetical protein